jgi:malate synthase
MRMNIDVGIQYLASWLRGNGAAAIYNLMEDAATAEISRSQIWQWIRHGAVTDTGEKVTLEKVTGMTDAVMEDLRRTFGEENFTIGRFEDARRLFEDVALSDDFPQFLTLPAYEQVLTDEQTTA